MAKDKKTSEAQEAVVQNPAPIAHEGFQDEFAGQGGSYVVDPATNQRKPIGDLEHG